MLDVDKALAELLCESGSVLASSSKSHEEVQVEACVSKFFRGGVADILEVSWRVSGVGGGTPQRIPRASLLCPPGAFVWDSLGPGVGFPLAGHQQRD